jgi:ornithine carbamoyltransferase
MASVAELGRLRGCSFGKLSELEPSEFIALLDLADEVKRDPYHFRERMRGASYALIFEKHSTRTRVSFEVGLSELGANSLFLSKNDIQLGRGESIADTARVLSGYVQGIILRTSGQDRFDAMVEHSSVPVVNALTDKYHPCQILADLQTVRAHRGDLSKLTLAWVGDGNNVAHSMLLGGALAGMEVRVASPEGYSCDADVVVEAADIARTTGGSLHLGRDPQAAVKGADVVVTDVFASMGQENEAQARRVVFAAYQVDEALMARAAPDAVFLHCLPAHRGEEVTAGVLEGTQSVVWEEAENRLHAQKALLLALHGAAL